MVHKLFLIELSVALPHLHRGASGCTVPAEKHCLTQGRLPPPEGTAHSALCDCHSLERGSAASWKHHHLLGETYVQIPCFLHTLHLPVPLSWWCWDRIPGQQQFGTSQSCGWSWLQTGPRPRASVERGKFAEEGEVSSGLPSCSVLHLCWAENKLIWN